MIKWTALHFSIDLSDKTADGYISVNIRNSGQGIDPKDLPYVFERFYKGDKSRSVNKDGTGLGLYIVKTIIDIHGGRITVRSKFGEYTEFEIMLPTVKDKIKKENGR